VAYKIKIPKTLCDNTTHVEELIDLLLDMYPVLKEVDLERLKEKDAHCTEEEVEHYREEFFQISQEYGKLRQEYGIYHFRSNELFNRNTLTGFKLGSLKNKLYAVKKTWVNKIDLNYIAALELIDHFSHIYLFKKEEEK